MSVRRAALEALLDITGGGAYANLRLKEAVSGLDEQEAKWVFGAVYTTLDNLLYIDHVINAYAKGGLKPKVRGVLRLGVCQALYMGVPESAACNESVKLIKEIGKGALSGYVNGVMRSICRNKTSLPPLPKEPLKRLSIQYSYPEYMVSEYLADYGEGFTEAMLAHRPEHGMTIRPQYPYTPDELIEELDTRGWEYGRGGLDENAFKLSRGFDAAQEPLFKDGRITVQGESAMLVARAVAPAPGMRILDTCAAPGGKSAYMASLSRNGADITAWELHPHRVELMRRTFERLGVKAGIEQRDASTHYPDYDSGFNAVLIDAPCSGLGVPGKPDARYAKNDGVISSLTEVQQRILEACAGYVAPGGRLIYATCTISRRENQEQIEAFLQRHPEFEGDSLEGLLPRAMWRRVWGGCMIQLYPHLDGAEGFFLARLRRR